MRLDAAPPVALHRLLPVSTPLRSLLPSTSRALPLRRSGARIADHARCPCASQDVSSRPDRRTAPLGWRDGGGADQWEIRRSCPTRILTSALVGTHMRIHTTSHAECTPPVTRTRTNRYAQVGETLRFGYYDQRGMGELPAGMRVLELVQV